MTAIATKRSGYSLAVSASAVSPYCSQAVVRSATNRSLNRPRAPTGLPLRIARLPSAPHATVEVSGRRLRTYFLSFHSLLFLLLISGL